MRVQAKEPKVSEAGSKQPILLGPFLGQVTQTSIKIWLHLEGGTDVVYVTIHEAQNRIKQ